MNHDRQLQTVPNGVFLAGAGAAILIFQTIFLNPVSRSILAVVAAGWGVYTLISKPENRTQGWVSIAAGAGLFLLGGLFQGLATVAGIGMIVAGGISWLSGFFRKRSGGM